ncbi:MAG: hypothetical protein AAF153_00695, partial [Pseudomonadota bacterium]
SCHKKLTIFNTLTLFITILCLLFGIHVKAEHEHKPNAEIYHDDPSIPHYEIIKKLGQGGKTTIYLITDENGKLYAAKYWDLNKELDHLRFGDYFDHATNIYHRLAGNKYVNQLQEVIGHNIMIIDYIDGKQLATVLSQPLNQEQIVSLIDQYVAAMNSIYELNIIPWDADLENIMVSRQKTLKQPWDNLNLTVIDPTRYLSIDELVSINTNHDKNDFNVYSYKQAVEYMRQHDLIDPDQDYFVIDESQYNVRPPLVMYEGMCENIYILSILITKLAYYELHQQFYSYRYDPPFDFHHNFGFSNEFIATPLTDEIKQSTKAILSNIKHQAGSNGTYTEAQFKQDFDNLKNAFNLLAERTKYCVEDIERCLVKQAPL